MSYEITKIGNEYNNARRVVVMIESANELNELPVEKMAVDSIAKTVDYSVYAILGLDKQWHRLA